MAGVATAVGTVAPVVGAPIVAIALGALLRATLGRREVWSTLRPGAAFAGRYVLQAAVVVFGLGLSLTAVARVGLHSLPVMLGTLAVCLLGAWLLGRALGVSGDMSALVGAGTGICGASAIGAVAPAIAATEATVAYAVSTIFVYNVAAALIFPPLGHLLGLTDHGFGLWAGTAVNDTSSVVAAGFTFSPDAGRYAVVVKLVRSLMIAPVVVALAAHRRRRA
ncbi:MAG: putative sulfate exporter family transporter, partial [Actinocatenispora sp.]